MLSAIIDQLWDNLHDISSLVNKGVNGIKAGMKNNNVASEVHYSIAK